MAKHSATEYVGRFDDLMKQAYQTPARSLSEKRAAADAQPPHSYAKSNATNNSSKLPADVTDATAPNHAPASTTDAEPVAVHSAPALRRDDDAAATTDTRPCEKVERVPSKPSVQSLTTMFERHKVQPLQVVERKFEFIVSHVDTPQSFWVQPVSDTTESLLQFVSATLETQAQKCGRANVGGTFVQVGQLVCARYSGDDNRALYRAQVMSLKGAEAFVFYVDFGNAESLPVTELFQLPPALKDVCALAVRCSLDKVFPIDDQGLYSDSQT